MLELFWGVSFLSLTVAVEANGETELNKKEPLVKPHGVLCAATHSCTVAYRGIPDPGRSLRALLPPLPLPPAPLHLLCSALQVPSLPRLPPCSGLSLAPACFHDQVLFYLQ